MRVNQYGDERYGLPDLARTLLAFIPMVIVAYSFFIWPVLYGQSVEGDLIANLYGGAAAVNSNTLLNRLYIPAIFAITAGLVLLQGRRFEVPFHEPALFLLLGLFVVFALSLLWSDYPALGLRRFIVQCLVISTIMLACFSVQRPQLILENVFWLLAFLMAVNIVFVVLKPAGPIGHEGIYPQKNYLGVVAATASLFALYKMVLGRGLGRFIGLGVWLVALIVLVASKSKTSLGLAFLAPVAAFGIAIICHQLRVWAGIVFGVLLISALFLFWIGESAFLWTFSSLAEAAFGDPTLTSRTTIWEFSSAMINQRPWLGYGFASFWSTGDAGPVARNAPGFVARLNHSHNGYIDMVIQIGLIGFAYFLGVLFFILNAAGSVVRRNFALSWFLLTVVIYNLAVNLLETGFFYGFGGSTALFLTIICIAVRLRSEDRDERRFDSALRVQYA